VYVEGIPFECDETELWNLFAKCGNLVDMRLPRWNDSNRLRGYGHFDFDSEEAMLKAIKTMDKHTIGGRYLRVTQAKTARSAGAPAASVNLKAVPASCTTLFVKNLPYDTDEDVVQEAFSAFGKVANVRLPRWHHTGKLKGFGYIEFAKPQALRAVLQSKDPIMVSDRAVSVDPDVRGGGRPKSSFRDASGRQWAKTEGRQLRNDGGRGGRGGRGDRGGRGGRGRGMRGRR